ncbi:MAG: T9SS type A sorting domain-containing protein, partial [Muribaculaceae bacterium]
IDGNTLRVTAAGAVTVEAVNMLGIAKPLYAGSSETDIDLSDLPAGLYVIRVNAAAGSTTAKFLKK